MAKHRSNKKSIEIKNIKASNDAYYKALSARDIRAMQKVWTCASDNILIAPPSNPHVRVGWAAIKKNWETYWLTFDQYVVSMRVKKVNTAGRSLGSMALRLRNVGQNLAKRPVVVITGPIFLCIAMAVG